ncbi:hypothetical protein K474DRAFT_1674117 [Panus rudis PR-1116 ss-1]|nr:hypothetical protein K474DRAFT_1674117 [Panus rudis PR-1116 ss-1]
MADGWYGFTFDQILSLIHSNETGIMLTTSAMTITVYDLLLTFPQEMTCIWKRKFSAVTVLYAIIRYATVLYMIFDVSYLIGSTQIRNPVACSAFTVMGYVLLVLANLATATFSCMRVWAIWQRNIIPVIPVFFLSMFIPAIRIFNYSTPEIWIIETEGPLPGCWGELFPPKGTRYLPIVTRVVSTSANGLVLILTWIKTAGIYRESRIFQFSPLWVVLMLSSVLTTLDLVGMILTAMSLTSFLASQAPASNFILINTAFMIDLRSVHFSTGDASLRTISHSTIQFAGNIGAPLHPSFSWDVGAGDDDQLEEEAVRYSCDPLKEGLSEFESSSRAQSLNDSEAQTKETVHSDVPIELDSINEVPRAESGSSLA